MSNISEHSLPVAAWRKSSYSGSGGDDCLEVAEGHPTHIPVRDSKAPLGPALVFRAEVWSAFVDDLKRH
ncbi:DUF397 domain-containing protein [Streptomyces scabiei]|uniref:DUF397 domain-containing protein n=1 Tax=Streptomyces scabiei TaxID=1930 RepID=UPI0029B2F681|nr:DUF397 domain-containing protein [Streptomyces scabiei]MDX3523121.1 DUF397 domain-containing protein [Streptomyces scabiei]